MSVLIKGMKMPKNCGECKFCRMTYTQYGEIFSADCTIKDFPIKWSELDLRDGLCPLIELPPHGRLIDADALHEELYALKYDRENEWFDGVREARGVDVARVALLDAPTIIPAEESK